MQVILYVCSQFSDVSLHLDDAALAEEATEI